MSSLQDRPDGKASPLVTDDWPHPPRISARDALISRRHRLARDCGLARWCGVEDLAGFLCRLELFDARTHAFELRWAAEREEAVRKDTSKSRLTTRLGMRL